MGKNYCTNGTVKGNFFNIEGEMSVPMVQCTVQVDCTNGTVTVLQYTAAYHVKVNCVTCEMQRMSCANYVTQLAYMNILVLNG